MKTGVVIVAAGGNINDFEPLVKSGNMTIIERVIANFLKADIHDIVVVTGNQAGILERKLKKQGIVFIKNDAYKNTEMFDSVKLGIEYFQDKCGQILITPADIPFVTVDTINKMLSCQAGVVVPAYRSEKGHPIKINTELCSAILGYSGKEGLRGALLTLRGDTVVLEVEDAGVVWESDRMEDCSEILAAHTKQLLRPCVSVEFVQETVFFNQETAALLRQIDAAGSVKDACELLNLSYSKAWKMLQVFEDVTEVKAVERYQGGKEGGKALLTGEGKQWLSKYEYLQDAIQKEANCIFGHIFDP